MKNMKIEIANICTCLNEKYRFMNKNNWLIRKIQRYVNKLALVHELKFVNWGKDTIGHIRDFRLRSISPVEECFCNISVCFTN